MALGSALATHRGELRADFQRYYGLRLDELPAMGSIAAAELAENLPPESALRRAVSPSLQWGEEGYLLSLIEYELRLLMWSMSDPKRRGSRPEPIETPAAAERRRRLAQPVSRAEMGRIADTLGIPEDRR